MSAGVTEPAEQDYQDAFGLLKVGCAAEIGYVRTLVRLNNQCPFPHSIIFMPTSYNLLWFAPRIQTKTIESCSVWANIDTNSPTRDRVLDIQVTLALLVRGNNNVIISSVTYLI